jgi:amino acid adenylation domain-containing protein
MDFHLGKHSIPRRSDSGPCALSFAQQRLWFLNQLEPDSAAYNQPTAVRLSGPIDLKALQKALDQIVARHETLRTTFVSLDGSPAQVIAESQGAALRVIDLREQSDAVRDAEVERLLGETIQRPFDLSRDLMLRALLLRLGEEEHILLLVMHHIACDAWSMGILWRELAALYRAFAAGQPSPLPELPVQYVDYAAWQRDRLNGEILETQLSYWKKQLENIPALQLPIDRPRPAAPSFRGAQQSFTLPKDLSAALKGLSRQENATPFMTLLAAFQTLLHRYTGQEDVAVGSPIAGRNRSEVEGLIGFFVNTLVLRADLSGDPGFREQLRRVRKVALAAYAHQNLPFEKLVEEARTERNLGESPLFRVMFGYQNVPTQAVELPGLMVSPMEVNSGTAKFDLILFMREETGGLRGSLEYNTDLFDNATIARMLGHFQTLLKGIVADPDQRLSDLPLLTEAERHQLLVEWNQTEKDYPKDKCVHELFDQQVERTPDAVAVIFPSAAGGNGNDEQLTYRELNRRANQLAHYLRKMGVGPAALVGICMKRSLEMVVALLGILKAGGAYVPLDPEYPNERLAFMLEDTRSRVLLTRRDLAGSLPARDAQVICLDTDREIIEQQSAANPESQVAPENLAYALYTSGSTGTPKAVAMSHRPLCNLLSWQLQNFRPPIAARTLQFASMSFDVSFQEIFSTWCSGGTLVMISEELRRDAAWLLRFLKAESVERLFLPFIALQQLAEAAEREESAPLGLREIITAGEPLQTTRQIASLFDRLENCRLYNQYGPTESHVVTSFTASGSPSGWSQLPPIGRPIDNTQIYLLDGRLQPVPIGVTGELHIGGACLARGYLNRPELTAEKFIPNPFSDEPEARLYKSGDLARYLPDGNIEFFGRIDDQLKIRGFRIEPGEIENALAQHAAVELAAVVAREDSPGRRRLVAYVVPRREETFTGGELRSFLKSKLPDYMTPAAFVTLEALPLTPNGKVDRRALPTPLDDHSGRREAFVAPRDTIENALAGIWQDVLGLERVGVHDDFFDLGGHSLLAVQMLDRVERLFGARLSLVSLLPAPTIRRIAEALAARRDETERSLLRQIQTGGAKPPFFFLHGDYAGGGWYCLKLAPRLGRDQPFYALAPHGINGSAPRTIETMAAAYLQMVRAVQPQGPYFLGGYCNGGVIAFEMARQLERQGQRVQLVLMIAALARTAAARRWLDNAIAGCGALFNLAPEARLKLFLRLRAAGHRVRRHWRELLRRAGWERRSTRNRAAAPSFARQLNDGYSATDQLYIQALLGYVPKPYRGRVALLAPAASRLDVGDPAAGWRPVASELEVRTVPGNHRTCIRDYLEFVADHMKACLENAQRAPRGPTHSRGVDDDKRNYHLQRGD